MGDRGPCLGILPHVENWTMSSSGPRWLVVTGGAPDAIKEADVFRVRIQTGELSTLLNLGLVIQVVAKQLKRYTTLKTFVINMTSQSRALECSP
ncbi:UNVERIFIED_CONTAM: hypothetical protein Sradi_1871200 [Sesamum radiatum]|uniref:Uncharacterized protein n=1 Tax=Sesamum radiatum TaxID=300843 RepID=A0AAW2TYN7_SESRA